MFQANECRLHLENAVLSKIPVDVMVGKKNLEVRPSSMHKGEIVKRLLQKYNSCKFLFCAGDDRTDEDMFRVLQNFEGDQHKIFTCTIGSETKMTRATSHVTEPEGIINLLTLLAD
jgi:trehalose 6-phosphate synthase/phosphatase